MFPATARMLLTELLPERPRGELLEEHFYGRLAHRAGSLATAGPAHRAGGRGDGFALRYENWLRAAKVPILVLNATTLNTGHSWQFTATWMGEPPSTLDERVDASRRLRRMYYHDAPPDGDLRRPTLGKAVAASACVPGLFPPVALTNLYDGIDVELVDGGVHDNQGIASLLEQDCTVVLVSDASGQLRDTDDPKRGFAGVLYRSNSVLMKRVRGAAIRANSLAACGQGRCADSWACTSPRAYPPRRATGSGARSLGIPRTANTTRPLRTASTNGCNGRYRNCAPTSMPSPTTRPTALMAAGYLMTKHDLADALPDLAEADPTLELRQQWPFWRVLTEMTSPDASRLVDPLVLGRTLFLRGPRGWTARLRNKIPFLRAKR